MLYLCVYDFELYKLLIDLFFSQKSNGFFYILENLEQRYSNPRSADWYWSVSHLVRGHSSCSEIIYLKRILSTANFLNLKIIRQF